MEAILHYFERAGHKAIVMDDSTIHVSYESETQYVSLTVAGIMIQERVRLKIIRGEPVSAKNKKRGGLVDIYIKLNSIKNQSQYHV